MALDVSWKTTRNAKAGRWIGSLDVAAPLESLLHHFGQANGVKIDPYGNTRLSAAQWNRLIVFASQVGYPTDELQQIRAGIPPDNPEGILDLRGD